jgi:hypothetical protein
VRHLSEILRNDSDAKTVLVNEREQNGGNQALHFAATKGDKRILDILLEEFKADVLSRTKNGLSI